MPLLSITKIEARFLAEILTITRDIAGPAAQDEPERFQMADRILWKLRNKLQRKQ